MLWGCYTLAGGWCTIENMKQFFFLGRLVKMFYVALVMGVLVRLRGCWNTYPSRRNLLPFHRWTTPSLPNIYLFKSCRQSVPPRVRISFCCVLILAYLLQVRRHVEGQIIVFDDSKLHKAFNDSTGDRLVLIVDMKRPSWIPLGTAEGEHTPELDAFIDAFR